MIAYARLMLVSLLPALALAACASGPVQTARAYQDAVAASQAEALAGFSGGDHRVDPDQISEALAAGQVGLLPDEDAWRAAQVTAKVEAGDAVYLLAKQGEHWKVRCASIGPYHDYTPEMTLLLAVHLIKSGKFDEFRRLLPSSLEQADGDFPAAFKDELRRWAAWMQVAACRPFDVLDGRAELVYSAEGGRKRVVLVLEEKHWKIESLW